MKRFCTLFFFFVIATAIQIYADDIIVLQNGDIINAIVKEITKSEVKYKKASNPNGPIYSIEKNEILSIKYENGEIDKFNKTKTNVENASGPCLKEAIPASNNQELIVQYNREIPTRKNKSSNTITNYAYVYWGVSDSSIMSDSKVEISILRRYSEDNYEIPSESENLGYYPYCILIRNKSNYPIYIDLGNSYKVYRTEDSSNSIPWYDGTVFTETQGSSKGLGLGLGAVTNALGIGGTVGTIANGLSVGGSSGNGVSMNRGIQRFISIAPNATMKLPGHPYIADKKVLEDYEQFNVKSLGKGKQRFNLKKWELRAYNPDEAPFGIDYYISYSNTPDFLEYTILPIHLYSRNIYGRSGLETLTQNKYSIQNPDRFLFGYLYLTD